MASDIVERLRSGMAMIYNNEFRTLGTADHLEAADLIEQQQARIAELEQEVERLAKNKIEALALAVRYEHSLKTLRDLAGTNTICANITPSPGSYGHLYEIADQAIKEGQADE